MNKILSLSGLILAVSAQASVVEIPGALMECSPEAGQTRNYTVAVDLTTDTELGLSIVKSDVTGTMKEWSRRVGAPSLRTRVEVMPDGQNLEIPFLNIDMGNGDALNIDLDDQNGKGPWLGVLKLGTDEGVRLICREVIPARK